ncbi:uncharacterized protein BO95DRAFT_505794 [Aspergillus brunneoviolaceus CBS 621.78]|uniref:Uncharacterized protein n=1 Tax=Aspergillus brunneoviolaceus CBS 621.78 TaxID=1450534 RepID=A0ACD1FXX6_9EURO|nr:hypothetical protein BO95DRAFT_505794 [Aspergillus brunneoviolaceus CBS 621.78]RAH41862.1 hypothetical protein BO95DRAFT_505794 [Aspergillus brunneoviolaceus CBS 621.78]
MKINMSADKKDTTSGSWAETVSASFPESEGYTIHMSIHQCRGPKMIIASHRGDDELMGCERRAVHCAGYQGEILGMALQFPESCGSVPDTVLAERDNFFLRKWPETLLPMPTYGAVIARDEPQHVKSELFGQLFRLYVDPEREAQRGRVDCARLFVDWLHEWKKSLVAKGPLEEVPFELLLQPAGRAREISDYICPACSFEDM